MVNKKIIGTINKNSKKKQKIIWKYIIPEMFDKFNLVRFPEQNSFILENLFFRFFEIFILSIIVIKLHARSKTMIIDDINIPKIDIRTNAGLLTSKVNEVAPEKRTLGPI